VDKETLAFFFFLCYNDLQMVTQKKKQEVKSVLKEAMKDFFTHTQPHGLDVGSDNEYLSYVARFDKKYYEKKAIEKAKERE